MHYRSLTPTGGGRLRPRNLTGSHGMVAPTLVLRLIAVALLLVTGLVSVTDTVRASGGGITNLRVLPTSMAGGATGVRWAVSFTAGSALTGGVDSITLAAPSGTALPPGNVNYGVIDLTSGINLAGGRGGAVLSNNNTRVTFGLSDSSSAGDSLLFTIDPVTNPAAGTALSSISVSTSQDGPSSPTSGSFTAAHSISNLAVNPVTLAGGATGNRWAISFTTSATGGMVGYGGAINISAPAGTAFFAGNADYTALDVTTGMYISGGQGGATVSNGGATLSFGISNTVPAGDTVLLTMLYVTNPPAGAALSGISVSTTSDTVPAAVAGTRKFSAANGVSRLSVNPLTFAGGATGNRWTISFTTSATGGMVGYGGAITVSAPAGTVFSGANSDYGIYDLTAGYQLPGGQGGAAVSNGGATLTCGIGGTVRPGDTLLLTLFNVTNPPAGTALSGTTVSTTSDTVPVPVGGTGKFSSVTAAPNGVGVGIPNLRGSATGVPWTYTFFTSAGGALTGGTSTITLTAPPGTVFPTTASSYTVNGTTVTAAPARSGSNTVTVTVPAGVNPGNLSPVSVAIAGVTNPAARTDAASTFTVSTSADTSASSPPQPITFASAARSGAVSRPTVTVTTTAAGATGVTWMVSLGASASGAMGPQSSITVAAPAGTRFNPGWCSLFDLTNGNQTPWPGVTLSNGNATATVNAGNFTIAGGDRIAVVFSGVTNPAAAASLNKVQVSTASDTRKVSVTGGQTMTAPHPVHAPAVQVQSSAGGATGVTWSVSLTASTTGGMTPAPSFTVAAPAGTGFANSGMVIDLTNGNSANWPAINLANGNATATLTVNNFPVNVGDQIVLELYSVTNPAPGTSLNTTSVSTLSDHAAAHVAGGPTIAASAAPGAPTIQVSSLTGGATGVTWSVGLTASSHGGMAPASSFTVAAPAGTQFANSAMVIDVTNGNSAAFPTISFGNGNATATLAVNNFPVNAGDQIVLELYSTRNPPSGTSLNGAGISTASDSTPAYPTGEPSFT